MVRPDLSRPPLSGPDQGFFAVEYEPAQVEVVMLDQRLLPGEVVYRRYRTADEVAGAIRDMVVRGAPAIGIAAAYALVLVAHRERATEGRTFLVANGIASRVLDATRPTAVNLAWALARMGRRAAGVAALDGDERARAMQAEAEAIHREDVAACRAMGRLGAADVPEGATVLTHCNAGALATGGYGTALGVIRAAHESKKVKVLASETRPYLQGARLTAWELAADGVDVEVITDSMSGHFFQRGVIDFVVVGSDRVCANGDVANKIGTYTHAVLAGAHDVPFTVAAPWSTIDLRCASADQVPIEERSRAEVARVGPTTLVADGIGCRHPAFDVTPARLVRAIYTERGVIRPAQGERPEALRARAAEAS